MCKPHCLAHEARLTEYKQVADMLRRRAKPLLGTLVEIGIGRMDGDETAALARADLAINAAFAEIAVIHDLMSFHRVESDIGRINASPSGTTTNVDRRTATVLHAAWHAAQESQFAFDCTVAQELVGMELLPSLWPKQRQDASALPLPADRQWRMEGQEFIKLSDCIIDLGGIAKGYAVDQAIDILQRAGCAQALINAGGDMRQFGDAPAIVHLRSADDPADLPLALTLHNQALASSAAGGLHAHGVGDKSGIIDGVSRRPVALGAAASIIAPTCMEADILTKVMLASGNPDHPMLARHRASVAQYNSAGKAHISRQHRQP
jgi:thiamine biosynthesis lipoprotein